MGVGDVDVIDWREDLVPVVLSIELGLLTRLEPHVERVEDVDECPLDLQH